MDCNNNTAKVSWSSAKGSESYIVTVVGQDDHRASCETDGHQCDLTELHCGQIYNVNLTTVNNHCQTEMHTNVTICTREQQRICI